MTAVRRTLQIVALVGTILVGILCLALVVSQTPWFKDWLRRYVVRESKQYLNGELSIGGLGGNLFYGVELRDVAVDVSGRQVVAVKALTVDYNVFQLISGGINIDDITIQAPTVHLVHDADGWNVGRLVREQRQEARREGPGRAISLDSITLTDGTVTIDDRAPAEAWRLPSRIEGLHLEAGFQYAPVHYTVTIDDFGFRGTSPDLTLEQLKGTVAVRDDNLYVENLAVRTGSTTLSIDGVIEQYLERPVVKMATSGTASLPELSAVVPALEGYALTPTFDVKANGPTGALGLDLDVRSEAGAVRGKLTADLAAPDLGVAGGVDLASLNLAPILKNPRQRSDLTGHATLDLTMKSQPASAPVVDRLDGTFTFEGPKADAAGYAASNVRAKGRFDGPRLSLDARANAYGGAATATGTITLPARSRPLAYDLRGSADGVDLRNLPASTGAPKVDTNLSVASYHVTGTGGRVSGDATLRESTVEGATLAAGTVAEFSVAGPGRVSYSARGHVANLDLQRIGQAFDISALDQADYATALNSDFDVRGSGTALPTMTLDATGTLTDSQALGATVPRLAYEAHLAQGRLAVHADGRIVDLDPSRLANREDVAGQVTAALTADVRIDDLTEPITPEAIDADVSMTLEPSTVGGLQIDSATIEARYADQVAHVSQFTLAGPDVKLEASGTLALDESSTSNLTYHVEALDLAALAAVAGQEGVDGSAVLDGTITGNRAALTTTGTLDGSGLGYQNNTALDLDSTYTVVIPDLQFAQAKVEATTTASLVKAGAVEIKQLEAKTTYTARQLDFDATVVQDQRELAATGDVVFHPDHQEIHLPQLALRTQGVEWRTAPGAAPAIQYGGDRIAVQNLRLVNGAQTLAVDGELPLKEGGAPGELKVAATDVSLADVDRLALLDRGLSGELDATATVTGSAAAPGVDAQVRVDNGGFENYQYDSLTADVQYGGPRLGIDARLQQSPTEQITAKGTVPMTLFHASPGGHVAAGAEDEIALHVQADNLGLGLIQGFTTQVTNVTGTLSANVEVTGSGRDPHLNGTIEIANGSFGVPLTGVSYTGLDTTITLTTDTVRIPNLQIVDEEGETLSISGDLAVHARQVGAVNISISSENFEVVDNELGDVGVETALEITGELRQPRIEGDIALKSARLEVDRILALFYDPYSVEAIPDAAAPDAAPDTAAGAEAATRQALSRAEENAAAAAPPPAGEEATAGATGAASPLAMDVTLSIPDNLVLRGNGLRPGGPGGFSLGDVNMTVGGDLEIRKEPGGPILLLGSINTVRGTYEFQGRRFDLVRGGTVRFTGEPQINPILDISAEREIPNTGVEARVHITGTAKAPELALTSTPPLDESDILALIVFNRPVNELGSGERASLAATAGGIATGFIAAPLGESIGRALDLDQFEITTSTDNGDLGAGITVGQQIGDRAFFRLRQQFGERTTSEFMLEFQLADFLRLAATAAPETSGSGNRIGQRRIERAGVDLIFFFSY